MSDEAAEVPAYNAMPGRSLALIKLDTTSAFSTDAILKATYGSLDVMRNVLGHVS